MKYIPLELEIPTYSIYVNQPEGYDNIAVLENMSSHAELLLDRLSPILDEIKEKGVEGVVVNLSLFPSEAKKSFLAFFEGTFVASNLEGRYIGITEKELGGADSEYKKFTLKVFDCLDAAVESFSLFSVSQL